MRDSTDIEREVDERLTVLHLIDDLTFGGAQTLLLDIVENMTKDIRSRVCYIGTDTSLKGEFEQRCHTVGFDERVRFDPRTIYRLHRLLRRGDVNVVHTHLPYAHILGRFVKRAGNFDALVSTYHNVPDNYFISRKLSLLEDLTYDDDDLKIAVSRGAASGHRRSPIETNWRVIPNGIDVEGFNQEVERTQTSQIRAEYDIPDETRVVLSVGRYAPEKSHITLVDAMELLSETNSDVRLFVVGHGPLKTDIRARAETRGVEDCVYVTGRVPETAPFYSMADVFVLPSRHEGMPITLFEAMAAGLPVIATRIPGVEEVITPEFGELFPVGDEVALANLLADVLASSTIRESMAAAALETARTRYDISVLCAQYRDSYFDVIEQDG